MFSRWPTNRPFGSLAASATLSKLTGLKATKKPFLPSALAAAGSECVSTSTATRPASISCWKRRRMEEPPERNISTLMPVSFWNASAIFWPCSIGVEVYQTTLPSAFALATSTASCAPATPALVAATTTATHSVRPSAILALPPSLIGDGNTHLGVIILRHEAVGHRCAPSRGDPGAHSTPEWAGTASMPALVDRRGLRKEA